jgi:hypothetical protein
MPRALLIQPWIHDFAAYDLWVKPLGLLRVGAFLREMGVEVDFIDCLDSGHPSLADRPGRRGLWGHGAFFREEIPKPASLAWFPRKYKRYGIPPLALQEDLRRIPRPDVILMGTGMTYWYRGVQETIRRCRDVFPESPVLLGGIYATLLPSHAQARSGADSIVAAGDWESIARALSPYVPIPKREPPTRLFPAWDLMPQLRSVGVQTSRGCPFRCAYCASKILSPGFFPRPSEEVAREIGWAVGALGATDVAFYDDALLWQAEDRLVPILRMVDSMGLQPRYHCPNGLHARFITPQVAETLRRHGFVTVRLGLESASPAFHSRLGEKIHPEEFDRALAALTKAGYDPREIGVYVMAGLPGQRIEEVRRSVEHVLDAGARPHLTEYSPIPGTGLWAQAVASSPFPIREEPLFHNNTLLPCRWSGLSYEDLLTLKSWLHRALRDGGTPSGSSLAGSGLDLSELPGVSDCIRKRRDASSEAHGDAARGEILLQRSDGKLPVME